VNVFTPTISRAAAWPSPAARIAVEPPRAASPPGIHALDRGLLRAAAHIDRAPLRRLQLGFGVLDDRVRRVAQRHDHQIDVHPLGLARRHRAAAAGGIRRAQLDHVQHGRLHVVIVVADELARGAQHLQRDAFLQRVVQFLDAHRHFRLGAAIDDGHVPAQPLGGAGGVHRGVVAADDHHFLAARLR
jgi:hypothetical protein